MSRNLCELDRSSFTVCEVDERFRVSNDLHQHSLAKLCSHDHINLFDRCKLLHPDLRKTKTTKHLSIIDIKSAIDKERWIELSRPYSPQTERQWSRMIHSTRYSNELAGSPKGAKVINHERKRNASSSDVIKTVTLKQPTKHSTVVLKTGYRQTDTQTDRHTDRQTHRQTDTQTDRHTDRQTVRQNTYLPFDRPYPFSLGNTWLLISLEVFLVRRLSLE